MKKLSIILLVIVLILSCLSLSGCKKEEEYEPVNKYEDLENFTSYVDPGSAILGYWLEDLPEGSEEESIEWDFYDTTDMHIIKSVDGISYSTASAYNFNDQTGELSYYYLQDKTTHYYKVEFASDTMTFKDANGEVVKTFVKTH